MRYNTIYVSLSYLFKVTSKLKPILLERIDAKYDGKLNTGDAFTLGVNFAQVKVCFFDNFLVVTITLS